MLNINSLGIDAFRPSTGKQSQKSRPIIFTNCVISIEICLLLHTAIGILTPMDFPGIVIIPVLAGLGGYLAVSLFWAAGIYLWKRQLGPGLERLPSVSILVAGRNEEKDIEDCLTSLLNAEYPRNKLEICFIDDHSTDNTLAIARSVSSRHPDWLTVLSAPDVPDGYSPKKNALLFGVRKTKGEILLFTDADVRVPATWIRSMVSQFDHRTGAVIGPALPTGEKDINGRLYRLERLLINCSNASAVGWGFPASACGQNLACRRPAFLQIGGFPHLENPSGDDDLLVQEIARRNWKVRFSGESASVAEDQRIPQFRQHAHSSARHQSTVRYYPFRWRAVYLFNILSALSVPAAIAYSAVKPAYAVVLLAVLIIKCTIDGIALRLFTDRLKIPVKFTALLFAQIMLPAYLLLRPVFLILPKYTWRSRLHPGAGRKLAGVS